MLTAMATEMDKDFHSYFDNDCKSMKNALRSREGRRPGRVRLAAFYNMSLYGDWDFIEKEDYLRVLGTLDEADTPSVIIANYALARFSCLNETTLYAVCCRNKCHDLVAQLETQVAASTAPAETLATLVSKMSSEFVADSRELSPELISRLHEVAAHNGGEVPLHGRLFAQWMHHAFPLDCPYPHEAGTTRFESPEEWTARTGHISNTKTKEEISADVAADTCTVDWEGMVDCGEESLDLPWSMTEELLAPRREESRSSAPWLAAALLVSAAVAGWPLARSAMTAGNLAFIAN